MCGGVERVIGIARLVHHHGSHSDALATKCAMNRRLPDLVDASALQHAAAEAANCQRCPLYLHATQVVFGEGPPSATIMLVGEQPGDQEDRLGRPFVGPAGRLLDKALTQIGLDRTSVYVTNVVKHFKHEQRGKRRLHKRPNRDEVQQCRWWLDQELALVTPKMIVALGATAAHELLGRPVVLARERGKRLSLPDGHCCLVTVHPSALLRMPDEAARHQAFARLVHDLKQAVTLANAVTRSAAA
jgi:uracil-DNA glycosylase family protein